MGEIKVSVTGSPIWRKSDCTSHEKGKARVICIGLEPRSICFRLQGCKTVFRLHIGAEYEKAVAAEAASLKPKRVKHTFRRGVLAI